MTEPIPTPEQPEPIAPTKGQRVILEGLRRACISVLMPYEPPGDLGPGARIAWYTGILSGAIDTLAARPDLYAPGEEYSTAAVSGYATALGTLFHARPREGMAYRLTAYCNTIHPAGLNVSLDPTTSAIHQTMKAAAWMLHTTGTVGTDPEHISAALREARLTLRSATAYLNDAIALSDTHDGGAEGSR